MSDIAQFSYKKKQEAIHSYETFIDLIGFRGGMDNFKSCHRELIKFVQRMGKEYAKAPWKVGDSHEVIPYTFSSGYRRKLVLMPRGHLKSTILSVGYVLWRIYKNPNIRIVVGSGTLALSFAFMRELRAYLEDPELIKYVWNARPHVAGPMIPQMAATTGGQRKSQAANADAEDNEADDKKVVWNNEVLQVLRDKRMKEPTIMAWSVGTIRTGFHCDMVLFDDIVTFANTKTPTLIETTMEWVRDIKSILDPYDESTGLGGEAIVLGTRYVEMDYYGSIFEALEEVGYDLHIRNIYENGRDNSDGYLWPERFNEDLEKQLRRELGEKRFTSQYLNRILNEDECTLHPDKVIHLNREHIQKVVPGLVHVKLDPVSPTRYIRPIIVVDPAFAQSKEADNTSIVVGGLDKDRRMYVFDGFYGKKTIKGIIDETYRLCTKWHIRMVWVEANGTQVGLINSFRDYFSTYYPIALRPFNPKGMGDKKSAISAAVEAYVTDGRLYVTPELMKNHGIRNEFLYFPSENVHDDFLDTLKMLATVGVPTTTGERQGNGRKVHTTQVVNQRYGGFR